MLSRQSLQRLSEETGYREVSLEKVTRLLDLLRDVRVHPLLKDRLALKGGTPINLAFGTPPRLSVDLDFNLIDPSSEQLDNELRADVEAAVRTIAEAQGYRIQESADTHAGRTIYLTYQNVTGTPDRIEIDLNYLHRTPLQPLTERAFWSPDPESDVRFIVVSDEELFAGKLRAMLDRSAPRDLFDVSRIPTIRPGLLDDQTFRAIFLAMTGTLPHPVYTYAPPRMDRALEGQVENALYPMLVLEDRPDAAELVTSAWKVVSPLLELTDSEREFVDGLQVGRLNPELITNDLDTQHRIRSHPALR